jgi:hypothetical protein
MLECFGNGHESFPSTFNLSYPRVAVWLEHKPSKMETKSGNLSPVFCHNYVLSVAIIIYDPIKYDGQ